MCQLSLAFIKRPKPFRLELKGRGDMQAVKSPDAQTAAMPASQFRAVVKGCFRQIGSHPQAPGKIVFHVAKYTLRLGGCYLALKDVLVDSVRPLGAMQRCEPDQGARLQSPLCLG
jgi:hypothetical protein